MAGELVGLLATDEEYAMYWEPGEGGVVLNAVQDIVRQIAKLQAEQVRLLAQFVQLRPGRPGREFSEFAPDELSAALRWTRSHALAKLRGAVVLTGHVPEVLDALDAGRLDDYQATVLADAVHELPAKPAHQVTEYVLARAAGRNISELRRIIRRAVLRFDPQRAEERRVRARDQRRVDFTPYEDGMASLWALLPANEALTIHRRLDAFAAQVVPDDPRTYDQRRADALVDLMLDPGLGEITVNVDVTVPASTLDGSDQLPAELVGYGTIAPTQARELAVGVYRHADLVQSASVDRSGQRSPSASHDSFGHKLLADAKWRRLLTHPRTGELLEATRGTYRPAPLVSEFVRARDQYCVFPGCSWPARSCDIDHRVPYPRGDTNVDNLNCLCRHHHRLKHEAGWTLHRRGRSYVWINPDGIEYIKDPEPLAEPEPGAREPGASKPGASKPGASKPGASKPAARERGAGEPAALEPGEDPPLF